MNVWTHAYDAWSAVEREELSVDQRIQQAQTLALLAIGQELGQIHHEGIKPEFSAGE